MGKHTSAYQIPLALLNLRGKKSCDPLFHLALFHFQRILGRRGSRWEKCLGMFQQQLERTVVTAPVKPQETTNYELHVGGCHCRRYG